MKRTTIAILTACTLAVLGAEGAQAQMGPEARRGRPMVDGAPIERIMSMRDRLELTEQQIAQLDALRAEGVQRRSQEHAALADLRSRVAAGEAQRSELLAFHEERAEAREAQRTRHREQVDAILTPEQLESLEQMRAEREAFRRGRASARSGRGGRGGWGPGAPGRGFRSDRGWDRGPRRGRGPGGEARAPLT